MFGIGMPEMLLLLAVALIVFGPKKLPELAKSMGRALGEFKRATSDIKDSIEEQTGIGEVRDTLNEAQRDIKAQVDLGAAEAGKADAESTADGDPGPLSSVKNAFDALNADAPNGAAAEAGKADAESTADGDPGPLSSVKNAFDALNADAPNGAAAPDTVEPQTDDDPVSGEDSNKNGSL